MKRVVLYSLTLTLVVTSCGINPNQELSLASFIPGSPQKGNSLTVLEQEGDNRYQSVIRDGKTALQTEWSENQDFPNYIYFSVDKRFYSETEPITIELEYFDEGEGQIILQYDSASDSPEPEYKSVSIAFRLNTKQWKKARYVINDAYFKQRQNFGGDFRLSSESEPLIVGLVSIIKDGQITKETPHIPVNTDLTEKARSLPERAVFAYYFYWYDSSTYPVVNLTNTPIDYQTMTWKDINWHIKQIIDISETGIDVILPVYWYDEDNLTWSRPGIEIFSQALIQLHSQGFTPPSVGLFLDTTSSQGKDLRTEIEQDNLYENIHFFFTTIPRIHWALTEELQPIIWFYTSNWLNAYDQSFIDYVYTNFEKDFDVRPYLIFDTSWDYPKVVQGGQEIISYDQSPLIYDSSYTYAGPNTPKFTKGIASISPGFDDHLYRIRKEHTYTDRKNGETYTKGFDLAIKCEIPWIVIETWNEYYEATEISETLQYGRKYLELTKEFISYFKEGEIPEGRLRNEYSNVQKIIFSAENYSEDQGINLGPNEGDGLYESKMLLNVSAVQTIPVDSNEFVSYLYFLIDDSFYFNDSGDIKISITYWDEGFEPVFINYDSANCASSFNSESMYKRIFLIGRTDSESWKTADIVIKDATFANNQNYGADFRLETGVNSLAISKIEIEKVQ